VKEKVYVETSVLSYLTARKSRDPIVVAHQAVTRRWWRRRKRFDLYCSQVVLREAKAGDAEAVRRRLAAVNEVPLLDISDPVKALAGVIAKVAALPKKAAEDALYIGLATVHGMDYLLTWNCRHIANAELRKTLAGVAYDHGYGAPVVCTPEELLGE
jgi:hypothetical protein